MSWERIELFKLKLKAFFTIFEGLSLKQIINFFLEGESPTLSKIILHEKFSLLFLSSTSICTIDSLNVSGIKIFWGKVVGLGQ